MREFNLPAWEYNVVDVSGIKDLAKLCDDLDEVGMEGWEMVSVSAGKAYFKRRLHYDWGVLIPVEEDEEEGVDNAGLPPP